MFRHIISSLCYSPLKFLSTRDCAHDEEWFAPIRDRVRQRRIRRLMREVLAANKEAHHRPALQGSMIANCSLEHRIFLFERVEDGTDRGRTIQLELHFVADASELPQVMRKDEANHEENSKHQAPSSREAPNIKLQERHHEPLPFLWSLVIGISLVLGAWNLELRSLERLHFD